MPKKQKTIHSWMKLYSAMIDLERKRDFASVLEFPAAMAMNALLVNITKRQPHGHIEYDPRGYYAVGTVSERVGHTPIEDGWRSGVSTDENDDVGFTIRNISEHIRWVVWGAEEHFIPEDAPFVFFWWGKPQPWPAPSVNKHTGEEMGPGYYKFSMVDHPGIKKPNPFISEAKEDTRGDMRHEIKHGVETWIMALLHGRYKLDYKGNE